MSARSDFGMVSRFLSPPVSPLQLLSMLYMAFCLSCGVMVGPSPLLLQLAQRSVHITSSCGLRGGIITGLVAHVVTVREIVHGANDVIEL